MVANTKTNRNWNPKLAPFGVRTLGAARKYKSAKYGKREIANRDEADSASFAETDHALAPLERKNEVLSGKSNAIDEDSTRSLGIVVCNKEVSKGKNSEDDGRREEEDIMCNP